MIEHISCLHFTIPTIDETKFNDFRKIRRVHYYTDVLNIPFSAFKHLCQKLVCSRGICRI
ncbi:hypothetical protein AC520_4340 [Enterobacter sp. OLF]|nr:hypothetical protein AC520_4340 [Enterobacter sp. OLF]